MFDPSSYRDTDFGLAPGESFEPDDVEGWPNGDPSRSHVKTVLGPIDPDDLGVCLPFVRLLPRPETENRDNALKLRAGAAEALESFALSGGRSVVDAATAGRDAAGLYGLAQRIPLHIIATTGTQSRIPAAHSLDADAMARQFVKELTSGMDDTPALAGLITVVIDGHRINDIDSACLRAAANAHLVTGAPVAVRAGDVSNSHDLLKMLQGEGVAAGRVILQHPGRDPDFDVVRSLAAQGAWCSIDRIGAAASNADVGRARLLIELFDDGYGDRILISPGQEPPALPGATTGGLSYLLDWFPLALMEAGATAEMVRSMLVDNPRHALAIVPPDTQRARAAEK